MNPDKHRITQNEKRETEPECLKEDQNILDQEVFRKIILQAVKAAEAGRSDDRLKYFKNIESLNFPPARKDNSWEDSERYGMQWIAQCFLINAALKRQDICERMQEVISTERKKLFWFDGEFGHSSGSKAPVHLAPLKSGLPKDVFADAGSAAGADKLERLFYQLMFIAADYPGWDEYIRGNGDFVRATGERYKGKKANKILTFESWLKTRKKDS